MRFLIFNRLPPAAFPWHEWIPEGSSARILCDAALRGEFAPRRAAYSRAGVTVEYFEAYSTSLAVEQRAREIAAREKIAGVVALSEVDILRAARVRDLIGLTRGQFEAALPYRDKLAMKRRAEAIGLPIPAYREVSHFADLIAARKELGFPFIVKSRFFGGSIGASKISSEADLARYARRLAHPVPDSGLDLIAERWVDGTMFHVDGFYAGPNRFLALVFEYAGTCFEAINGLPHGGFTLDQESPAARRVRALTRAWLQANPLGQPVFFHAEFFRRAEDSRTLFCEIACRTGGANIRDAFRLSTGLDIAALSAASQMGTAALDRVRDIKPRPAGWFVWPPAPGKLKKLPRKLPFEWVLSFERKAEPGQALRRPSHSGDAIAAAVFAGRDEEDLRRKAGLLGPSLKKRLVIDGKDAA